MAKKRRLTTLLRNAANRACPANPRVGRLLGIVSSLTICLSAQTARGEDCLQTMSSESYQERRSGQTHRSVTPSVSIAGNSVEVRTIEQEGSATVLGVALDAGGRTMYYWDKLGKYNVKPGTYTHRTVGSVTTGPGLNGGKVRTVITFQTKVPCPPPPPPPQNPNIDAQPLTLDFGDVAIQTPRAMTFSVANSGKADLSVSSIAPSIPDFKVFPAALTLAPGGNQKITVTFIPTNWSAYTETLTITSNDPDKKNVRITLKGNGVNHTTFGSIQVGDSDRITYSLTNTTADTRSVKIGLSGVNATEFSVTPSSFDLGANRQQIFYVTFSPLSPGEKGAVAIFETKVSGNAAPWSPQKLLLKGTGVPKSVVDPKPDGTAVLDLDPAPGDQSVRSKWGVRPGDRIDVQVLLNQEVAGTRTFLVTLMFDPQKLSVISGKIDGVFATAVSPGPPMVTGNTVTYGGGFLGSSVTAKGSVAMLTFQASSGFARNTEVTLTGLSIKGEADKDFRPGTSVVLSDSTKGVPVKPTPDFDRDGDVGFGDFFEFAAAFGQKATGANSKYDLDGDGDVGFGDFFEFAAAFGTKTKSGKAALRKGQGL